MLKSHVWLAEFDTADAETMSRAIGEKGTRSRLGAREVESKVAGGVFWPTWYRNVEADSRV